MAGFDGHRGSLNYLAVDPNCRKQGIARRLMFEAERLLTAAGCPKINVMVRRSNLAAAGFYDALGYQPDDVVVYGKRLIID
jgi:ribosomal protein S18 acetylase RimI-like enzyme